MCKKYRFLVAGIIIGMLCTITLSAFAETESIISVFLKNNIKFEFNGESKELPNEYVVLNYNGRTYVPARFVAEELGAEVDWDAETNTIAITQEEPEEEPETSKEDETNKDSNVEYKEVPVSKNFSDMEVEITLVSYDNNYWRVYLELENKGEKPIQLLQRETELKVDGKEYDIKDVSVFQLDTRWYSDIKEDESLEGYIILPKLEKDPEKLHLVLTILNNDHSQEKTEVEFNILLNDK